MAKAAGAVETAIAAEAKLDAYKLRADFPIFEQRFHGKRLAYLDSAVSAQKPRQVLDAQREFFARPFPMGSAKEGPGATGKRHLPGLLTDREAIHSAAGG